MGRKPLLLLNDSPFQNWLTEQTTDIPWIKLFATIDMNKKNLTFKKGRVWPFVIL